MAKTGFFWTAKDSIKEKLVESDTFGYLAVFVGQNVLSVFLNSTEDGYRRKFKDTEIEMSSPIHFSEFLTEKPLTGYVKNVDLDEANLVVDAGAYPGEFTIYAARKGAEVIALEPDPENAEDLRENVRMNGLEDKVTVVEKGLWDEKDQKSFERDQEFGLGSQIEEDAEITIQLDTLDHIASEHGEPDFVKMDIEGAEIEALKGAEEVLEDVKPGFAIATYHIDEDGDKTCHEVEEILEKHGYDAETGYGRHLTTYGSPE
ncbi:MAG: FkbM family methyltransferase [Candidatus Nanohalobium sp.]